jgi:hypothetical protein
MTIIDTTLYANGALRLSRHGAGRGGNVLVHVASGRQVQLTDVTADEVDRTLTHPANIGVVDIDNYFEGVKLYYER